jgi:hypothetical protein
MGGRGGMQGKKEFSFLNLCDFTLCDFSLEHNYHMNQGVPVLVKKFEPVNSVMPI